MNIISVAADLSNGPVNVIYSACAGKLVKI